MADGNGHAAAWQPPTPKFAMDIENAPKITLAGMEFPIPILAVKQNRIIVPALLSLSGMLAGISSLVAGKDADPRWYDKIAISTEQYDAMCRVVYTAVTRATPGFSMAEFDNMPIALDELMTAITVVAGQTGMMGRPDHIGEGTNMGEARPGEQPAA